MQTVNHEPYEPHEPNEPDGMVEMKNAKWKEIWAGVDSDRVKNRHADSLYEPLPRAITTNMLISRGYELYEPNEPNELYKPYEPKILGGLHVQYDFTRERLPHLA